MIKKIEFKAIDAQRFSKSGERLGNFRVDVNVTFVSLSKTQPDEVEAQFRFTVTYTGLGVIRLEGNLLYQGDAERMMSVWNKSHNLPQEVASEFHNAVFSTSIPEAVMLARDLQLPPPIPLPKISFKKGGSKPVFGPEVA